MTFIHDDLLGGDCNLEVSAADYIICRGFEELRIEFDDLFASMEHAGDC